MMLIPGSGAKFTTYTRHVPKVESLLDVKPPLIRAAPQTQIRVTMLTAGSDELSKFSSFDPECPVCGSSSELGNHPHGRRDDTWNPVV